MKKKERPLQLQLLSSCYFKHVRFSVAVQNKLCKTTIMHRGYTEKILMSECVWCTAIIHMNSPYRKKNINGWWNLSAFNKKIFTRCLRMFSFNMGRSPGWSEGSRKRAVPYTSWVVGQKQSKVVLLSVNGSTDLGREMSGLTEWWMLGCVVCGQLSQQPKSVSPEILFVFTLQ